MFCVRQIGPFISGVPSKKERKQNLPKSDKGRKACNPQSTHLLIGETNASKGEHLDFREYSLFTFGSKNIAGQPLEMEVGTRASLLVISEKTYDDLVSGRRELPLETSGVVLRTYTGKEVKPKGSCIVDVCHDGKQYCLPLLGVCGEGPSLLGRNWLGVIKLNWAGQQLSRFHHMISVWN